MTARLLLVGLVLLLMAIATAIALSCVREARMPPTYRSAPAVVPAGDRGVYDLSGARRHPHRGITPGALEAKDRKVQRVPRDEPQ